MKELTIQIPDYLYDFYRKIGQQAGLPVERVVCDTLFKLAGELSLEALHKKGSVSQARIGAQKGAVRRKPHSSFL